MRLCHGRKPLHREVRQGRKEKPGSENDLAFNDKKMFGFFFTPSASLNDQREQAAKDFGPPFSLSPASCTWFQVLGNIYLFTRQNAK